MLQGLQTNRAQLFFNWAPYHTHTHTHTAHVCRSLFSNFPAVGSVELNTLVEEQPSESLHMGSVLVVWLVNPCTNQGLWQQPGHINLRAQSQHKPELSASILVLACAISWAEWRIQRVFFLFLFFSPELCGWFSNLAQHAPVHDVIIQSMNDYSH